MIVWRLDTGAKGFGKDDGGSNGTNLSDNTKESEEMQIEALKEAYEELRNVWRREYFRSDPRVFMTTPHLARILCR